VFVLPQGIVPAIEKWFSSRNPKPAPLPAQTQVVETP